MSKKSNIVDLAYCLRKATAYGEVFVVTNSGREYGPIGAVGDDFAEGFLSLAKRGAEEVFFVEVRADEIAAIEYR